VRRAREERSERRERKRKSTGKGEGEWDTCQGVSGWEKIRLSSPTQSSVDTC
jgi:hypothetical protein